MNEFNKYFNKAAGNNNGTGSNNNETLNNSTNSYDTQVAIGVDTVRNNSIEINSTVNNSVESNDYVDKHNKNVRNSQNKIQDIINSTEKEAELGAKASAMQIEHNIRMYDLFTKKVKMLSLTWLIKSSIVVAIVGFIAYLLTRGIIISISFIPTIIKDVFLELISLLIIWAVLFLLQWLNRHKMKTRWSKNIIIAMFCIPFVILLIFTYNKYLYLFLG